MNGHTIERRAYARHRVFKGGRLAFGGAGIECTVRNISPGGARVDVASPVGLPEHLTLYIASDRFKRHCHKVWRHETRIGLAFD